MIYRYILAILTIIVCNCSITPSNWDLSVSLIYSEDTSSVTKRCHLLPLEKAYCNLTLFATIISAFTQQSVKFDGIHTSKVWFKTSLPQWGKVAPSGDG